MAAKIYANARFGLREDTLENWIANNPVLEKGEPAVISDSEDSRWLKIGDGKTPFNELPWKFAGSEASVKRKSFSDGAVITAEDNTEYIAEAPINNLTVIYPETDFLCSFSFTLSDDGDIAITLPESKYIGGAPEFANGENWELSIKNGIVVGGRAE